MAASDGVFVTRTMSIGCQGIKDQYADGKAAQVWVKLVGDSGSADGSKRSQHNREFLVNLFRQKGCRRILDVACGTGVDSVLLLEAGFEVTSVDASDKMLKHARNKRWDRRKEPAFDQWVIEEANWLTLPEDLDEMIKQNGAFDAIICLGNSFAHLVELSGDQSNQRLALSNFESCVKPGGVLVIDHRNFDAMLDSCQVATESIYYNKLAGVTTSILYTAGKPVVLTMDYKVPDEFKKDIKQSKTDNGGGDEGDFRLSYFPHRLANFTQMLDDAFPKAQHQILADFQPIQAVKNPGFYIHVLEKSLK